MKLMHAENVGFFGVGGGDTLNVLGRAVKMES